MIAEAVARYQAGVRPDAPWLPSNIEFVRRINGLPSTDDVFDTMMAAEYLVLGLGDVYLGAPLAVPLDPRHRLMTTKYNPARTWTASDTVGLGGQYLCVYGMDSPGGYQLVGRTVPIWSGHRQRGVFEPGKPWLLRFFDRVVWHPVAADELLAQRDAFASGRLDVEVEHGTFSYREHLELLAEHADDIAEFQFRQAAAFADERAAWALAASSTPPTRRSPRTRATSAPVPARSSCSTAASWSRRRWSAASGGSRRRPGEQVREGDLLIALEAMKLELGVAAPADGTVLKVLVEPGQHVAPGAPLAILAVGA